MLNESEKPGIWGELFVERYMREHGYEIVTANYHCRFGEIDIIAKTDEFIVFTEVKTRTYEYLASGREAVDGRKQERIVKTASLFLEKNLYDLQPRFDVAEVMLDSENNLTQITYIENAFDSSL